MLLLKIPPIPAVFILVLLKGMIFPILSDLSKNKTVLIVDYLVDL